MEDGNKIPLSGFIFDGASLIIKKVTPPKKLLPTPSQNTLNISETTPQLVGVCCFSSENTEYLVLILTSQPN